MNEEIQRLIDFLNEEQMRVKRTYNESGFNVTSAAYPIMKRYRDELKQQIQVLRANAE